MKYLLIALIILLGCKDRVKEINEHNYHAMEKDIVNRIVHGYGDEVHITAKIEDKYLVYYFTTSDGMIARIPINIER